LDLGELVSFIALGSADEQPKLKFFVQGARVFERRTLDAGRFLCFFGLARSAMRLGEGRAFASGRWGRL